MTDHQGISPQITPLKTPIFDFFGRLKRWRATNVGPSAIA
jgi:hypothetical protein